MLAECWCPIFATVLSYLHTFPVKCVNVLAELGDELSREFGASGIGAAHLAYLLAGERPFSPPTPRNRVALLGWSHADSSRRASSAQIIAAIRRTEVLDFASSLRGGPRNDEFVGRFRLLHAEFLLGGKAERASFRL